MATEAGRCGDCGSLVWSDEAEYDADSTPYHPECWDGSTEKTEK